MGQGAISKCMPQNTFTPPGEKSSAMSDSAKNPTGPPYAAERKAALRAVQLAAKICVKIQESLVSEETISKKDKSPVTVADYAAQAIIIHELTKAFPNYPFVAEEDSKTLNTQQDVKDKVVAHVKELLTDIDEEQVLSAIDRGTTTKANTKRWWCLDPIDGTLGFLRRGQYAVALALMEDDQPIMGVLGCPELPLKLGDPESPKGCILVGVRGQGAFQRTLDDETEHPIHVSENADVTQAIFTESITHQSENSLKVCKVLGVKAQPLRIDSQCKYATVARGDSHIYLRLSNPEYREKTWDHAAGALLVKEAGGEVCDFNGGPLDFSVGRALENNVGIVATNAPLHFSVVGAIQRVIPKPDRSRKPKQVE